MKWPLKRTMYLRVFLAGGSSFEVEVWSAKWTRSANELVSLTWTSVTGHRLNYVRLDCVGALVQRPGRIRWRGF